MPGAAAVLLQEDHGWGGLDAGYLSSVGIGRGLHLSRFFSSFVDSAHADPKNAVTVTGKGAAKPSAEILAPTPSASASKPATGATSAALPKSENVKGAEGAEGHDHPSSSSHEGKAPTPGNAGSGDSKEGGPSASKPDHSDAPAAQHDPGKAKGKGKGGLEDLPGKGKGKGKGKSTHRHGRSHSRGRHHHHHHHNAHHHHHHHRHHAHSLPRSLSQRRRLKRLLHRARQLRSHSPRRSRSLPWSDDEGDVRRFPQLPSQASSPTRRIASLQRKVGLLQVGTSPGRPAHLPPLKSSALSLDPALAAPVPALPRPGRAKVTAFLFSIGEDGEEADRIDQETDQAEIQEEAKSIVNAESAGYEAPTGVEQGEIEEFDHEMEEQAAHAGEAGPSGPSSEEPRDPGCPCPAWDPMKTALPEDLQHASLTMLQRRIRPENRVAPSLREAAASVEHAGRLFEGWVRRRQQLAEVLPELSLKMEYCRNRAKDFASSAAENALRALKERVDEGAEEEEEAEQQEEMAEGQMAFEAIGEAQSDYNEWAQEEDAAQHAHPSYLDQASFLSKPLRADKATHSAFQAFPPGQSPEQLAQAMGQIYGKPAEAGPGHMETPETPEVEAEEPSPSQEEVVEAEQEEEDVLQAEEVEDFGDFFRECGEFRIPATVLAARRAANEAYWAFDRAMQDAENKVGLAIQHSVLRGA